MREVCVIGTGIVPFGRHAGASLADIAWPAVKEALADAGVDREHVQAAWCGSVFGGMLAGQRLLARVGLTGIPITNVENACSSSATALREAWIAIGSGMYDVALVVGMEKLSKFGGGTIPLEGEDNEVAQGMVMPALYAMRARRYMDEYGLTARQLARVSVKARRHGALNPVAQYQAEVTEEQVLASRPVADPLTLLQCCPTGDGAAALVLAARSVASRWRPRAIRIRASDLVSGKWTSGYRDMTTPEITMRGAREAYEAAGLGPEDIDVAEVHDAFTIAELLYYEALGFCARGDAAKLLESGDTSLGGRVPVNPSGGLLSKGHPVAASGAAQAVEIVRQLQGRCGPRQVENARVGLTQVTGGGAAGFDHGACCIHIYSK